MKLSTLLKSAIVTSVVLFGSAQAFDKKVVIKMHDEVFRGQQTLKLKQLAKDQHPGLRIKNFDLDRVRLVAKSRRGQGTATLRVGQAYSHDKIIDGIPSEFQEREGYTFDRLTFVNPKSNSQGAWQMDLQGRIKVRRVVLFLDRKGGSGQPSNYSKSCTVTLETIWGTDLQKYSARANGRSEGAAKKRACAQAMKKCQQAMGTGDNFLLMCTL